MGWKIRHGPRRLACAGSVIACALALSAPALATTYQVGATRTYKTPADVADSLGPGDVVVVTERGMPGVAHTVAARAGVIGLSRTVAVEWAPLSIRVNCIAPGLTATEGLEVYPPEAKKEFPRANPMKRPGTPMEIAEAVVYLGASSGSFITGEVLTVDGGGRLWGELWTAGRPAWFEA